MYWLYVLHNSLGVLSIRRIMIFTCPTRESAHRCGPFSKKVGRPCSKPALQNSIRKYPVRFLAGTPSTLNVALRCFPQFLEINTYITTRTFHSKSFPTDDSLDALTSTLKRRITNSEVKRTAGKCSVKSALNSMRQFLVHK
jgi:hypothetical protein